MNNLEYRVFYRRHLPHIQPPGATLFVTFRLANSIPVQIQQQLIEEAQRIEKVLERIQDPREGARQANFAKRRAFGRWDRILDTAKSGPMYLSDRRVATLVRDSIHRCDGALYDLDAFCIMPNHVHIVFAPKPKREDGMYHSISAIMHSVKRYTARQANLLLDREGNFWQHENYDHVVRNESELNRIINYVLNNPVKAGLVQSSNDWKWGYCKYV